MLKSLVTFLVSVSLAVSVPTVAVSQNLIEPGTCELIVKSEPSLDSARSYARSIDDTRFVKIFESSNGWYAISIGSLKSHEEESVISRWKASGKIPNDSRCSTGEKFIAEYNWRTGEQVDSRAYTQPESETSNRIQRGANAYIKTSGGKIILHEAPTNNSQTVTFGDHGERVTILDQAGDWFQVAAGGGYVGWVNGAFIVASESELRARPKSQGEKDAELAGMATAGLLLACLITGCLSDSSDSPTSSTLHFANNCYEDVKVAVHYLDTEDKWRTRGWFELEAGESKDLYYVNETLRTKNSIVYFYAQSLDGSDVWGGDTLIEFGDEDLSMRQYQTSTGNINIRLSCN